MKTEKYKIYLEDEFIEIENLESKELTTFDVCGYEFTEFVIKNNTEGLLTDSEGTPIEYTRDEWANQVLNDTLVEEFMFNNQSNIGVEL